MASGITVTSHGGSEGFWFGGHFIRLVTQGFTSEAGTAEDIGFVAVDVAKALEQRDDANRVTRLLDPDQKGPHLVGTLGGPQSLTVISESGFYDVVIRSHKPEGKVLRGIVTREILPQIRRTGKYISGVAPFLPDTDLKRVQQRVDGNKAVSSAAGRVGCPFNVAHDQKNTALTGHRTQHWVEVTGHKNWVECCDPLQQAIIGTGAMGYAGCMAQAEASGLVGEEVLPHANSWAREYRQLMGRVFSPGMPWTPSPGTKRANQLGTLKNKAKKLKAKEVQTEIFG